MPKKSESGNGNKGNNAHFPKQPHAQKPDREDRPGKQERPGNAGGQQGQQARPGLVDGRSQDAQERKMERDENRDSKKMAGGNAKNGCFPKLFMLLLPFAAVGTYFFLMS